MTERQIRAYLAHLEAALRSTDRIEVWETTGVHTSSEDGRTKSYRSNGSRTIRIELNGGAQDTVESPVDRVGRLSRG